MKYILRYMWILVLCVALVGCGGRKPQNPETEEGTIYEEGQENTESAEGIQQEITGAAPQLTDNPEQNETSQPVATPEVTAEPQPTPIPQVQMVKYTTDKLRVRTAPSTEAEIYTILDRRTEVGVIAEDGEWTAILLDDNVYYVASRYLKEKSDSANGYLVVIDGRTWKQPRCPSTDERIKKLWYIYTMEYYSAIKRNTFESHSNSNVNSNSNSF